MKKWSIALALGATSLATLPAGARPGPIPPPPGECTLEDQCPSAGFRPADPGDPPPLPPPTGKPCRIEPDQLICDPGHAPDPTTGKVPDNNPGQPWRTDMSQQMRDLQTELDEVMDFSSRMQQPEMLFHAEWLQSVLQLSFWDMFSAFGVPKVYPFGAPTRGDFNYHYYHFMRPIYYNLIYRAQDFYSAYEYYLSEAEYTEYVSVMSSLSETYHAFTRCQYGFNGADTEALEDSDAYSEEAKAGFRQVP